MKTKLLTALFAAALLFVFSGVQTVYGQNNPHAYLNVTVYGEYHIGLVDQAEVEVYNSSGVRVLGPDITGPPDYAHGMIGFDISSLSAGTYTAKAWHKPRPNDDQYGETTFYYTGSGTLNIEIVLGPHYK